MLDCCARCTGCWAVPRHLGAEGLHSGLVARLAACTPLILLCWLAPRCCLALALAVSAVQGQATVMSPEPGQVGNGLGTWASVLAHVLVNKVRPAARSLRQRPVSVSRLLSRGCQRAGGRRRPSARRAEQLPGRDALAAQGPG